MKTSGLYDNFTGERNSVCMGQTIFGLTSTTGTSDIYDINFVSNVDDYINVAATITLPTWQRLPDMEYDLGGRPSIGRGLRLSKGRKNI